MTPQEFKAWFDGFTEAFTGLPNKTQWARIRARVAEIDGAPITERVYIDRYWPNYVSTPVFSVPTVWTSDVTSTASMAGFNSVSAMNDLGRVEAASLAA